MMGLSSLFILIIIGCLILVWQSAIRVREIAVQTVKKACQQRQLQFLDGSTSIKQLRIKRQPSGWLGIQRKYTFEYYDGVNRVTGYITMLAQSVMNIEFPSESIAPTIEPPPASPVKSTTVRKPANDSNIIQFPGRKDE